MIFSGAKGFTVQELMWKGRRESGKVGRQRVSIKNISAIFCLWIITISFYLLTVYDNKSPMKNNVRKDNMSFGKEQEERGALPVC